MYCSYADFHVREIDYRGNLVDLKELPMPPSIEKDRKKWSTGELVRPLDFGDYLTANDRLEGLKRLFPLIGQEGINAIESFLSCEPEARPSHVVLPAEAEKDKRKQIHKAFRELYPFLDTDTTTDENGGLCKTVNSLLCLCEVRLPFFFQASELGW